MKRYLATTPFSVSEKVLITTDTIIYAEPVLLMTHIYSSTTKKYIGKISTERFNTLVQEV